VSRSWEPAAPPMNTRSLQSIIIKRSSLWSLLIESDSPPFRKRSNNMNIRIRPARKVGHQHIERTEAAKVCS
jgi:hypothetical protein